MYVCMYVCIMLKFLYHACLQYMCVWTINADGANVLVNIMKITFICLYRSMYVQYIMMPIFR